MSQLFGSGKFDGEISRKILEKRQYMVGMVYINYKLRDDFAWQYLGNDARSTHSHIY